MLKPAYGTDKVSELQASSLGPSMAAKTGGQVLLHRNLQGFWSFQSRVELASLKPFWFSRFRRLDANSLGSISAGIALFGAARSTLSVVLVKSSELFHSAGRTAVQLCSSKGPVRILQRVRHTHDCSTDPAGSWNGNVGMLTACKQHSRLPETLHAERTVGWAATCTVRQKECSARVLSALQPGPAAISAFTKTSSRLR